MDYNFLLYIDENEYHDEPYYCIVELMLPLDDKGHLVKVLRNSQVIVFGHVLNKQWAAAKRTITLRAKTETELDNKVNALMDKIEAQLNHVYKANLIKAELQKHIDKRNQKHDN